jgi:hypothetical protein
VSWWYNWADAPSGGTVSQLSSQYAMDFIPMLWGEQFNDAQITQMLLANPQIRFLLALNEPNLTGQANRTPTQAAAFWPRIEKIALDTGVKIVGPQITWGTMSAYENPVAWMDAFYAAYKAANGNRDPQIDALGFHWYDYGLAGQLDALVKYGKPFWVTEFANWHNGNGPHIDSVAKQKAQMTEMVAVCESRADVHRYAWFTGRGGTDLNDKYTTLLGATGVLTELGAHYLSLPFSATNAVSCTPPQIAGNHGHTITIALPDLDSATDKSYPIQGTSGHPHMVVLTVANLRALKSGATVQVTSTAASDGHTHVVTIMCSTGG